MHDAANTTQHLNAILLILNVALNNDISLTVMDNWICTSFSQRITFTLCKKFDVDGNFLERLSGCIIAVNQLQCDLC